MTAPHNFSNTASVATLAGSLSSSDTAVVLDSFANFPAPPFTATIARNQPTEEIVQVTEVTGLTVTLTRGYDGTSAQAQSPGATFEHTAVAKHFRDAAAHVATTASAHGTTSPVVGANDVQTLSNKTVVALLALATAGAPALTADTPAGVTSKLLSLKQAGVEKAFVDYLGNLTAQAVTGTTATFSGALSAAATTLASLAVSGTASVAGLLTASGGVTVPAGKTVAANGGLTGTTGAFTGAVSGTTVTGTGLVKGAGVESTQGLILAQIADPAGVAGKGQVWAKSDGGVYTRAGTAAVTRVPVHWGSGTTLPATGRLDGDTYRHTGLGCLMRFNGTAWRQAEPCAVANTAARTAISTTYSALLYDGFEVTELDTDRVVRWNGARWVKVGGPPELIYESASVPGSTAASGAGYVLSTSVSVPAHTAGTLRCRAVGAWTSPANAAALSKLQFPAGTDVLGSVSRGHNNSTVNAPTPIHCDGYIASDGTARTLGLYISADPLGASVTPNALSFQVWLI